MATIAKNRPNPNRIKELLKNNNVIINQTWSTPKTIEEMTREEFREYMNFLKNKPLAS